MLVRFAFRDILDDQPGRVSPGHEGRAEKLRAVIDAKALRQAALEPQLFKDADQPMTRERGVDLDGQRFPVKVVDHIEGPEARARV